MKSFLVLGLSAVSLVLAQETSGTAPTGSESVPVVTVTSTVPVVTETSTVPVVTETSTVPVVTETSTVPVVTETSTVPVVTETSTQVASSSTESTTQELTATTEAPQTTAACIGTITTLTISNSTEASYTYRPTGPETTTAPVTAGAAVNGLGGSGVLGGLLAVVALIF
ncbi:uncharacterized protein UV8b_03457 [Ustilaginoidea virens]|uniref:GPI anchored serine-rich protein n=1 Tax=Ustilaginoidea virens TaxID=1159556 RepID=A0A8E5MGU0_USTVR|nr:uncharacterized protein UV8b_03457 [Ustilaginoidea virens]QUC19216.1 hypothetical protein UV8b_03457 [Ustilaginoidea virens]